MTMHHGKDHEHENINPEDIDLSDLELDDGEVIEVDQCLYIIEGHLQEDASEEEIQAQMEIFGGYLEDISEDGARFVWGGVLEPNELLVQFEAETEEEAKAIAEKNPLLEASHVVAFKPMRKWFILFGG